MVGRFADLQPPLDKSTLIVITTTIFLAWALMLSQAIESVTRVFYARADLDLIMSSPVALNNVFAVRIAAIALSVTAMALLLSTPFVDVLVIGGGPRWFAAYGVVITIGLSAAAMAVAITIALFRTIGASRTRLVAQILAAVIGAGFVIALQIAAIMSYGTLSRFAILTSDAAAALAPDIDSMVWWPARAAFGEAQPLLLLLAGGFLLLGAMMAIFSPRFADTAIAVSANCRTGASRLPHHGVSQGLAATGAAIEGISAAAPRSVAGVADPDATALSGAARADAVAKFRRPFNRGHADHPGAGDGGGPARRRSGLVDDIGRRRRRSGHDGAAAALVRDPRQDRSGADHDRRDLRPIGRSAGIRCTAAGGDHRARRCHRLPQPPPRSSSGSGCRRGAASSAAARPRRGWRPSRKHFRRSAGPRPPPWRWPFRSPPSSRPDDRRHAGGHLETEPAAGVSAGRSPDLVAALDRKATFALHWKDKSRAAMSTLTVTAKGQVTLRKDVLEASGCPSRGKDCRGQAP